MSTGLRLPGAFTGVWVSYGKTRPPNLTLWNLSGIWINGVRTGPAVTPTVTPTATVTPTPTPTPTVNPSPTPIGAGGGHSHAFGTDFTHESSIIKDKKELLELLKNEDADVILMVMAAFEYWFTDNNVDNVMKNSIDNRQDNVYDILSTSTPIIGVVWG